MKKILFYALIAIAFAILTGFILKDTAKELWTSVKGDQNLEKVLQESKKDKEETARLALSFEEVLHKNYGDEELTKAAKDSAQQIAESVQVSLKQERKWRENKTDIMVLMPILSPETPTASSTVSYVPVPLGDALVALSNQQQQSEQNILKELAGYLTQTIQTTCKPSGKK